MVDLHLPTHATALTSIALLSFAACAAPPTAFAPGRGPALPSGVSLPGETDKGASGSLAGTSPRPIRSIALVLLEPFAIAGLVSDGGAPTVSEGGEVRWIERLVDTEGHERLVVASTLTGAIRSLQRSGVPLDAPPGMVLTNAALASRAAAHLTALGIAVPSGAPTIASIAGRRVLSWARRMSGVLVPGDGTRVILAVDGALVGLAVEISPLAAAPSRVRTASEALAATETLLPAGSRLAGTASLGWIAPSIGAGDEEQPSLPRRLAWRMRGNLADDSAFEIDLDAGSLAPLAWDWAR